MSSTKNIESKLVELEKEKARKKFIASPRALRTAGPPQIESVTLTTSSKYQSKYQLGKNGHIDVIVVLSEPVSVTGEPTLTIQFDLGDTRTAKYKSGSGTSELLFRYIVKQDDNSSRISVPSGAIEVPVGSTIKSATNHHLLLAHPSAPPLTPPLQVNDDFDEDKIIKVIDRLSRSRLATLIVEGSNDSEIYDDIEFLLADHVNSYPSILREPVDGRENLLEIYKRRAEFSSHIPVAFLADLDYQVLIDPTRMLSDYPDIIWTAGYSLENDLYTDANPTKLIKKEDLNIYNAALKVVIDTFASEVTRWHIGCIEPALRNRYLAAISTNASLTLRGKELFDVLEFFHRSSSYSSMSKLLLNKADNHRPLITRLILEISNEIEKQLSSHCYKGLISVKPHTHGK